MLSTLQKDDRLAVCLPIASPNVLLDRLAPLTVASPIQSDRARDAGGLTKASMFNHLHPECTSGGKKLTRE